MLLTIDTQDVDAVGDESVWYNDKVKVPSFILLLSSLKLSKIKMYMPIDT